MPGNGWLNPTPLQNVPSNWTIERIESLCHRVTSGGTPSRRIPAYYSGTIPWFKTKELKDWYVLDSEEHISDKGLKNSAAKLFPPNTILFALYGDGITITSLGILAKPSTTNQACCAFITNPQKCYYLYLFYALKYHRNDFIHLASGGAQRNLSGKILRDFTIRVPPLPEQKAIAHILGTLDDKIELNRRMNETLEAMARAIFKSWFVDFDPVRAKMDGRQPSGMDAETAALFPDRFEETELGQTPNGWHVVPLPAAIDVNPTRSLPKGAIAPYLDMKNMPVHGHHAPELRKREFKSGTKFINGDTLLARITPCLENGKTAFVDFLNNGQVGWGSTEYIILRPKPPLPVEFGYYLARSDEFRLHAIQNMTGTSGRQRVPPDCFQQYLLAIPPDNLAKKFGNVVSVLMQTVRANALQTGRLTAMRDALLPKLLSGEIRATYEEESVNHYCQSEK